MTLVWNKMNDLKKKLNISFISNRGKSVGFLQLLWKNLFSILMFQLGVSSAKTVCVMKEKFFLYLKFGDLNHYLGTTQFNYLVNRK
jgi:hypothetical protein